MAVGIIRQPFIFLLYHLSSKAEYHGKSGNIRYGRCSGG